MRLVAILSISVCLLSAQRRPFDPRERERENVRLMKPEMIESGHKLYAAACSSCHGPTGEGGRGPKLSDGRQVRRLNNQQLFTSIQKGVPGTDMPAFPLADEKVWSLAAYVRSLSAPAFDANAPGDEKLGQEIFYGKGGCVKCHMIRGQGGYLGPDLSHIGMKRSYKQLRESLEDPSARFTDGYQGIVVKTRAGTQLRGALRDRTNYTVTVLDAAGAVHLLNTQDLTEVTLLNTSLMPDDYAKRLSAAERTDLLAFLSRQAVRTREAE